MEWINEFISNYDKMSRGNPLVAMLVLPLIGAVVGSLLVLMKNVPKHLWNIIKRNFTVTMSLNNTGYDGNMMTYLKFDQWFMESGNSRFSRNFFIFRYWPESTEKGDGEARYRIGIGKGTHFFFHRGRFYWFSKEHLASEGSEKQKEEIVVTTFGFSQNSFESLIDIFNKPTATDKTIVNVRDGREWVEFGRLTKRDINTFCMNRNIRFDIIEKIQTFIDSREWYLKKGFTHKISMLFFGPPGTGKTTLVKLLAHYFSRQIYILDLSACTNNSLPGTLASVKPGSIILVEDVDQTGRAVRNRKKDAGGDPAALSVSSVFDEMSPLTMSGVLNAIDGVVGLDNVIIIYTSNHPEDLDPAIRRKARMDHEFLIDNMGSSEIWDYVRLMYDDISVEHNERVTKLLEANRLSVPGCEVEHAYKEHPNDPVAFLGLIHAYHVNHLKLEAA